MNPKIYNTHLASNLFCAATSESQVLASLEAKLKESKDKPAVAFAVSEQYKSNTGEDAEENLDENGCIVDSGSKATKKNGHLVPKKRKKKNKKKALLVPNSNGASPAGDIPTLDQPPVGEIKDVLSESLSYKAGDFSQCRNQFIKEYLDSAKSRGEPATRAVANTAWNGSLKRAQILAGLSVGELKRRKFIPAGTWENPFKATVEAAMMAA